MKRLIFIAVMIFAVATVSAQQGRATYVEVGQQAPDFTVNMTDGSKVTLSELKGKTVLLNFWATWCGPCNAELARVEKEIIERFKGEDFVFLPVSRGEEMGKVVAFLKEKGFTFVSGLDPNASVYGMYAEGGIPRNFVIDKEGKIALCEMGYTSDHFEQMIEEIAKILSRK